MEEWLDDYVKDAESMEERNKPLYELINHCVPMKDTGTVKLGQIVMLPFETVRNPAYRPYVAVIGRWTDDMWLCVPCGHLSVPVLSSEMSTGLEAPLAVLQPGLGRLIPTSLLMRGYFVCNICTTTRIDAYDLFRHLTTGTPLLPSFGSLRGTAITDILDFKMTYQNEERYQWEPLQKAVLQELGEELDSLPAE